MRSSEYIGMYYRLRSTVHFSAVTVRGGLAFPEEKSNEPRGSGLETIHYYNKYVPLTE